jgi:D-proline reductase (dithiol) PrdB
MKNKVDSYRFLDFGTRQVAKAWIKNEPLREVPWSPFKKPLVEATVSVISSAALALKTDEPFDQDGERRNPWWGDPSYRVIPRTATEEEVEIYHLHIDPSFGREDLNCILPLRRLEELQENGEIGSVAPRHYSYMGYTIDPTELLEVTVPEMVRDLREDEVDVVLLVPT